jgi:glucosamine 6-phosphate synthetase-like amidotransferase/phosphosugar isomerase protein
MARVVLHDGEWEDYEKLHKCMEKQGFKRTITSDKKVTYQLPDAECDIKGNFTLEEIMKRAKSAATQTKKKYGVLVSEVGARKWHNLKKVQ